MYTEVIMMTCMIDAVEGLDVVTSDIPGAFIKNDYSKRNIHIKT